MVSASAREVSHSAREYEKDCRVRREPYLRILADLKGGPRQEPDSAVGHQGDQAAVLSILTIVAPARECAIRTSSEVDQGWLARSLRCDRDYRVKLGAVFLERLGLGHELITG